MTRPAPRLQTENGCLTEAGFDALVRAPVGRGPAELAAHVAKCPRCQDRLLAGQRLPGPVVGPSRRPAPPPWRIIAVLAAAILMFVALLLTAGRLR